ncbi:FecR family protein [Parapedobacter sp. 10938]|uniref:FecR family protein n=1 Tax=Parapedobacter flavus TaxID=3110225 RepID=UPI002DBF2802|nr:FecR family protein [Parapedobacter sp. 10938]MEC3880096.1 FecR family protein [Parapedobacter sp. 10938]
MEKDPISDIIERYLVDSCSTEENKRVEAAFLAYLKDRRLPHADAPVMERISAEMQGDMKRFLATSPTGTVQRFPKKLSPTIRWAAAALLLLSLSLAYHFWAGRPAPLSENKELLSTDLLPGTNKASLILADGSIIDLSDEREGIVVKAEAVTYMDGSPIAEGHRNVVDWNTIRTPKGGQYKLVLADGTTVWLNAASALRYPLAFDGKRRVVELLEGEGYFEVTPNKEKPFQVVSKGQYINVVGTTFNINAYEDEPTVRTTLIEGTIKVVSVPRDGSADSMSILLKPGEETTLLGNSLRKQKANMATAVGWKNGMFVFDNTDLKAILRQISRWYDFEVDLEGIPARTFSAEIPRSVRLSTLLKTIESSTGFTFRMEQTAQQERRLILNE